MVVSKYAKIDPKDGACCPNFKWRFCTEPLTYLQIALPIWFVVHTAPGPQGLGSQGSGFSTHRWFKQTSPVWQSGSLTHSGPHPVMVSGFGIMPGTQLQMALPTLLTVQMVLGPQGEGWQGFTGALVVRLTKMWIGDRGTMGIRLDLKCFWIEENIYYSHCIIELPWQKNVNRTQGNNWN